jgi:hypothetical protein
MPEYRVTFPRGATGPVTYTAHAASREHAEKAAAELYRYDTRGADPGAPKTTPVYGKIPEE